VELDANGRLVASPTVDDVRQALADTPHPADWHLVLDAGDAGFMEACAGGGGGYSLRVDAGGERQRVAALDAHLTSHVLALFLKGDREWQRACAWRDTPDEPAAPRDASGLPPSTVVAIIALFVVLSWALGAMLRAPRPWLDLPAPFDGVGAQTMLFVAVAIVLVVVILVASKLREARQAARWPETAGRITASRLDARRDHHMDRATSVTDVPVVEYEFTVGGRRYRGSRIGIGEDSGGANSQATLQRYPVGATVVVFYDPANPQHCVLEREMPAGIGRGCAGLLAVAVAVVLGAYELVSRGSVLLEERLQNGQGGVVMFATVFGTVALLFYAANRRLTRMAMGWPTVSGKVTASSVEIVRTRSNHTTTTSYTPAVEFAYEVRGLVYRSRQITFGAETSGSRAYAARVAARYPEGGAVIVHYDPSNPANAALELASAPAWLLLAVAGFCFAVAAYASGVVHVG